MKPMADCLVSCVEDSDVKIRDASAISLGVLLLVGTYIRVRTYAHVLLVFFVKLFCKTVLILFLIYILFTFLYLHVTIFSSFTKSE